MVIEDDETEDDDASFWQQSHQKPSLREKSAWTRCSTHKAKVRKGEVKEELLQVKEEVLEVEQPDSPVDSEVMEIDAPAAEVQAAQPAQPAPPLSSDPLPQLQRQEGRWPCCSLCWQNRHESEHANWPNARIPPQIFNKIFFTIPKVKKLKFNSKTGGPIILGIIGLPG